MKAFVSIGTLFWLTICLSQSGQFFDSVSCRLSPKQQYAIYLPEGYSPTQSLPVVIFGEPGGRAALPVKQYRTLADTYRLLLVCPYGSRNGPYERSMEATYAVLEEVKSLYPLDQTAIFISGFSGGARLATLLAMEDSQFRGVIACGATFPQGRELQGRKIPYVIVVGNRDMNYLEGIQMMADLEKNQNPSILIEFDGHHMWPDSTAFSAALAWQMARIGKLPASFEKDYQAILHSAKERVANHQFLDGFSSASYAVSTYDGALDISEAELLKNEISLNPDYQKAQKNLEKEIRNEAEQRRIIHEKYGRMLSTLRPDTAFSEPEWQALRASYEKYTKSKDEERRLSGVRLLEFGRLLGAEQTHFLLENERLQWALNSASLWTVFASGDSNAWLMRARVEAALGHDEEAIRDLGKAFELGFSAWHQVDSDPYFEKLRELPGYESLEKTYRRDF